MPQSGLRNGGFGGELEGNDVGESPQKLVVALLGCGTVGKGVVDLLAHPPYSSLVRIKTVFVRSLSKPRPHLRLPVGCRLVDSISEVLDDEEIDCVVEMIGGGTGLAKEAMIEALKKNKHVVTANKAALSLHLDEFQDAVLAYAQTSRSDGKEENKKAMDAQPHGCEYVRCCTTRALLYEAAICGGIPIVNVVRRGMLCDQIRKIVGILNGTTNYMLTEMGKKGLSYDVVLKDAQARGFAEADPTADVDGWDARSKLCILAKLAFGLTVNEAKVFCDGIQNITDTDFQYAKMIGHTVKLLGIAEKSQTEEGDWVVNVSLSPVMVPLDNDLARIDGVTNVVQVFSSNLDSTLYVGPGAGRYPTANSVVSDILEIASRGSGARFTAPFPTQSVVKRLETDFVAEFFVRFIVSDQFGVIHKISGLFEKHRISIFSILQTPIIDAARVPFAIVTDRCKLSQVTNLCSEVEGKRATDLSFIKEKPMFIRYYK